jgi:uncharacterized protein YbaR (Trm112 family)
VRRSTLDLLACPSCRGAWDVVVHAGSGRDIETGALACPGCAVVVPILHGFPLFGEALAAVPSPEEADALAARLFGTTEDYASYEARKLERGALEPYAAFHPFNESTRAIEPLLASIGALLKPGDAILDTWCRSGWNGEWLAARFPEQTVVAYWEGDSSVLGYRGFRRWLGPGRRSSNLDVLFVPPERPLPFRDGAFAFVHAPDSLHRYGLYPFAAECLRVATPEAVVAFPHVHLTNSEPDPWFERGCTQRHGRDYRAWLDRLTGGTARQGWVLSEADLWEGRAEPPLQDASDTPHYNGFVLIAPELEPDGASDRDPRFILNPLFRLHFARGSVRPDPTLHDGAAGHMFERHPIYRRRLPAVGLDLDEADFLVLALAATGLARSEITRLAPAAQASLDRLRAADLLVATPVSVAAHELQRFHANQQVPASGPLQGLLDGLAGDPSVRLVTDDGDSLSGADLHRLLAALAPALPPVVQVEPAGAHGFVTLLAAAAAGAEISFGPDATVVAVEPPEHSAPDDLRVDGEATLRLPGAAHPIPLARLADAAWAFRAAAAPLQVSLADLSRPSALLACLVALAAREPVRLTA